MVRKLQKILMGSLFLGVVGGACGPLSLDRVVPTPSQDLRLSAPATDTPETLELLPTPTLTLTAPLPPAEPPPTSTPTPGPAALLAGNRIQFPPGGTWVEVTGTLENGASKTYVLAAMEDQVMSVSVRQSWLFTLEVADATRSYTDPDYESPFWRGTLPATGDYFITLNAHSPGDYTLRVAINPPGKANQYFDFVDPQHASALRYSDEFVPTDYIPVGDYKREPTLVLGLIRMDFLSPVTNLREAYFLYGAMDDPAAVADCTQPSGPQESLLGQKVLNDYQFTQSQAGGAGAGNIYDQIIYRIAIKSVCYEFIAYMHSGNILFYDPGTVREFDRAALLGKFEEILSSFTVQ